MIYIMDTHTYVYMCKESEREGDNYLKDLGIESKSHLSGIDIHYRSVKHSVLYNSEIYCHLSLRRKV